MKKFFQTLKNLFKQYIYVRIENKSVYDLYSADQINLCYNYFKKYFKNSLFFSNEKKLLEFSCTCAINIFEELKKKSGGRGGLKS